MLLDTVNVYFGIMVDELTKEQIDDIVEKMELPPQKNPIEPNGPYKSWLYYGVISECETDRFNLRELAANSLRELLPKATILQELKDKYDLGMLFKIEAAAQDYLSYGDYDFSLGNEEMRFLSGLSAETWFNLKISSRENFRLQSYEGVAKEIKKLKESLDSGTITQETFNEEKKKLIFG